MPPEVAMPEIAVKGRVTRDGRIEAVAPEGLPEGEVELIVRIAQGPGGVAGLIRFIKQRAARGVRGRTKEEIDRSIREERDSWE
jgi:hypothetical protein